MKFPGVDTTTITGYPLDQLAINLNNGWNLLSGITCDVPVSEINDPNNIIVSGTIYGRNGAYYPADTIKHGKGYWIKVSASGTIKLSCTSLPLPKIYSNPAFLSFVEEFPSIEIIDGEGNGQTLYFSVKSGEEINLESFSMPPLPPPGAFDARFSGDYRLTTGDEATIEIQASAFPLTVSFYNLQAGNGYVLKEVTNNNKVVGEHDISEGISITISNRKVTRLLLSKTGSTIPSVFSVAQNYPNPFNPTTTIKYGIPNSGKVSITLYNALGQQVRTLVDKQQEAGYHTVVWDARNDTGVKVGSGIYFYVVKAGKYRAIRKMLLVK